MGRKSKLTESQWVEIERRVLEGETFRPLAREYGVTDAAIRQRVSSQAKEIKAVAEQIVDTEKRLAALPISSQITTQNLAANPRIQSAEKPCGAATFIEFYSEFPRRFPRNKSELPTANSGVQIGSTYEVTPCNLDGSHAGSPPKRGPAHKATARVLAVAALAWVAFQTRSFRLPIRPNQL